ncbi:MAG: efflux RND transporter periplasmic adaptor subunit [Candidatus Krumholzibacteria bacterium]|nr:efflux RND transporter periplasmic adaptor subunit [Candidatus Krumholzibacteria bacterium]
MKPRRRTRVLIGLTLATAAVVALALWGSRSAAPPVLTAVVQRGEFIIDITTMGQVEAVRSRNVSRKRVGRSWSAAQIVDMAPEGSVVKESDFLVQLDMTEARKQLEEAQNSLLNAQAELARQIATSEQRLAELQSAVLTQQYSYEQTQLRTAAMTFEAEVRRREQELELKKAELALSDARERLAAQRVIAQAERDKAEFEVRRAELLVEQSEEALAAMTITAPEPGLVVYKTYRQGKVKVGDQAWPGMDIIELPDLSAMQVRTRVNEIDVRQVAIDQDVIIAVDALADQQFRGRVARLATLARAEGEAKVKVFDVDVLIEGEGGDLRPGMTAQCRIVTGRIADAVFAPLEAVFARDGQSVVFVADGELRPRPVVLGPRNDNYVVIEDGLAAGEVVSLRDPDQPFAVVPAAQESDTEEAQP